MEPAFVSVNGVEAVVPGYTGGDLENPKYSDVISGKSGHIEAIQITYNPKEVSYNMLIDIFWRQIDPTDPGGQFADRGTQYQTAIFYHNEKQKLIAEKSKNDLTEKKMFKKPIVTKILKADKFYIAEEYHHKYYKKNPIHYSRYKILSGREDYINKTWRSK